MEIQLLSSFLPRWYLHHLSFYHSKNHGKEDLYQIPRFDISSTVVHILFLLFHFTIYIIVEFQVVPSVVNGGIMALYFVLWGKGLKASGPSV